MTILSEQGRQQMWERMERGSKVAFQQAPPPRTYVTPSAGAGGGEAQQIWVQN